MINISLIKDIAQTLVPLISICIAWKALKLSNNTQEISITPILFPSIKKGPEKWIIQLTLSTKDNIIAKNVSLVITKGHLRERKLIICENESLVPNLSIIPYETPENIDGSYFELKYQNFHNKHVKICGRIHLTPTGGVDFQELNFML